MTLTVLLLVVAGVLALGDWIAVAAGWTRVQYLLKPAVTAVLVAVAVVGHVDHDVRPWLVAALALGLVGDIALVLSRGDEPDAAFLGGLGAFLLGHVAYVLAFLQYGIGWKYLAAGALVTVGIAGLSLPSVLRGAARTGGRELAVVVGVYSLLLGAMAITASGTAIVTTAVGGALFLVSDSLLARQRFVGPLPSGRVGVRGRIGELVVIISYHAAQALILIGLLRRF